MTYLPTDGDAECGPNGASDGERDQLIYSYVLARESSALRRSLMAEPLKTYEWSEWEYYLRLMGPWSERTVISNARQPQRTGHEPGGDFARHEKTYATRLGGNVDTGQIDTQQLAATGRKGRQRPRPDLEPEAECLARWSWLSNASPLMSQQSEGEWILERVSAALECELDAMCKGIVQDPPVGMRDAMRRAKGNDGNGRLT